MMDLTMIKEQLHEYIERADDKHLEAIYTLLEKEMSVSYQYDEATLAMLDKRRENYLDKSKTYTVEETLLNIRSCQQNGK